MIGLSRQMTLRRSMDVVANNIANANTTGFKVESLLLENTPAATAEMSGAPTDLQFVDTWGMGRDFTQGSLESTGRPLDIAIEGDGFFAVDVNGNEQYTRDGRFRVDNGGQLVTADGSPVLSADTRSPILLNPNVSNLQIVDGGAVMQDGVEVDRIGVFDITDLSGLSKQGNGRYIIEQSEGGPVEPEAMLNPMLQQGFIETSNVQSIRELTNMMTIMRSYQSVAKFLSQAEDLNRRAIERIGKV
jgi:flagellar basal-body rod protein FlgF